MIQPFHIRSFAGLLLLWLMVAIWKYAPSPHPVTEAPVPGHAADREAILEFWEDYNQATAYRIEQEYEKAAEFYSLALQRNSDHLDALYYYGSMNLFLREFEKSEQAWLRLDEHQPNSPRTQLQLGTLYSCMVPDNSLFDLENAIQHFETAWSLNREESGTPLILTGIHLLKQNYMEAEQLISVVTASNTMSYRALFLQGYLAWARQEPANAGESLNDARNLYHSLNSRVIKGEGATAAGARAMLSEDRFCDPFEPEIERVLTNPEHAPAPAVFRDFDEQLKAWRDTYLSAD